jgi:hypothetical protein
MILVTVSQLNNLYSYAFELFIGFYKIHFLIVRRYILIAFVPVHALNHVRISYRDCPVGIMLSGFSLIIWIIAAPLDECLILISRCLFIQKIWVLNLYLPQAPFTLSLYMNDRSVFGNIRDPQNLSGFFMFPLSASIIVIALCVLPYQLFLFSELWFISCSDFDVLISALTSNPVQSLFFQLISWINELYQLILTSLRLPFLYDYWIISDKGLFRRNHLSFHMWMNNETLFPSESTS